jgi:DNA-binding transcriptional MerR regulator
MSKTLKIGAAAKRTGLSVDAIRFYERKGLLKAPLRSEGGFRLFQENDIDNLRLIRSSQSLGFSLDEIRDLLSVRSGVLTPCADVKRLLQRKLEAVHQKIAELTHMEKEIVTALKECKRALRSTSAATEATCSVLSAKRERIVSENEG